MVRKREETLEEGLNRSANKRGLTGAERHRYIGGTLQHLGKAKPRHKGDEKHPRATTPRRAAPARPAARRVEQVSIRPSVQKKGYAAPALRKVETKPATRKPYVSPALTKRERLDLTVKENKEAGKGKTYRVYSIYNKATGHLHKGGGAYRSMAAAKKEAKIEQDAYNHPRGIHTRGQLGV